MADRILCAHCGRRAETLAELVATCSSSFDVVCTACPAAAELAAAKAGAGPSSILPEIDLRRVSTTEDDLLQARRLVAAHAPWHCVLDVDGAIIPRLAGGMLGAYHRGRLVGLGAWGQQRWSLHAWGLWMAAVLPEYRGQGVHSALIKERLRLIAMRASRGVAAVYASTRRPGRMERHGFSTFARIADIHHMVRAVPAAETSSHG